MVYREFAEFLEEGRRRSPSITPGFLLFATLPILAAARSPSLAIWLGIASVVGLITKTVLRSRLQHKSRTEYEAWLHTLRRFMENGQLESRSHPGLVEDLEACASLRKDIERTLSSGEWNRLAEAQG